MKSHFTLNDVFVFFLNFNGNWCDNYCASASAGVCVCVWGCVRVCSLNNCNLTLCNHNIYSGKHACCCCHRTWFLRLTKSMIASNQTVQWLSVYLCACALMHICFVYFAATRAFGSHKTVVNWKRHQIAKTASAVRCICEWLNVLENPAPVNFHCNHWFP